jgi:hypothetical protein
MVNIEQKEWLGWTPLSGVAVIQRRLCSSASNSPVPSIVAYYFHNRFPDTQRSQWVCFMLRKSMREKLIPH